MKISALESKVSQLFKFIAVIRDYGLERFDRYYSSYPAICTDNVDPEGRGRIRLKVPMLNIPGDPPLVNWALPKLAGPMNASNKGVYHTPDVDDEVWVEFLNGDLSSPIYVGGWWSSGDLPSEFASPSDRGIKTTSGHVIRTRDGSGQESILVRHFSGSEVEIDASNRVRMVTSNGDVLELDPSGGCTMTHRDGSKVELTSSKVAISNPAGSQLTLTGGNAVLSAPGSIKLKSPSITLASANVSLGSEGATSPVLKGDVFMGWLVGFVSWAAFHTHVPTVAPTLPPPPPPVPAFFSLTVKVT